MMLSEVASQVMAKNPHIRCAFAFYQASVRCYDSPLKSLLEVAMHYGARNKIKARVTAMHSDDIMSLVKFDVTSADQLASVLTTESLHEMGLRVGDEVTLVVKAINVLPVKE